MPSTNCFIVLSVRLAATVVLQARRHTVLSVWLEGMELEAVQPIHALGTVLQGGTLRPGQLQGLVRTIVSHVPLESMELEATPAAHALGTVLQVGTRHLLTHLGLLSTTVSPAMLASMWT